MAITIVNQSVGNITYTVFGGSASGSGVSPSGHPSGVPSGYPSGIPSGSPSGSPSGWPSGYPSGMPSGVVIASGVVPYGSTASGIPASGAGSFTVVFGWEKFPSYTVSANGVVTISTSVKP